MSSLSRDKALQISNLSYGYRGDWSLRRKLTLKPFSLEVFAGEAFGFLGHNGSGKTTSNKCILNLIRPTSGEVRIFGVDHRLPSARASIGYLPEQPYFYDNLTVLETLQLYASLAGIPSQRRARAIDYALERVHLTSRIHSRLRSLSKGLTQRVAMAQAIVAEPRLLILDEPFSGLDPLGRKEFRDLLFEMKQSGVTIFMASHILSDVEFLCDRVSILARGELQGVFDLKDVPRLSGASYELVLTEYSNLQTELQQHADRVIIQGRFIRAAFASREHAERALRLALQCGAVVESFQMVQGGLEELFVKLVSVVDSQHG